jgi:hypothetical protein
MELPLDMPYPHLTPNTTPTSSVIVLCCARELHLLVVDDDHVPANIDDVDVDINDDIVDDGLNADDDGGDCNAANVGLVGVSLGNRTADDDGDAVTVDDGNGPDDVPNDCIPIPRDALLAATAAAA